MKKTTIAFLFIFGCFTIFGQESKLHISDLMTIQEFQDLPEEIRIQLNQLSSEEYQAVNQPAVWKSERTSTMQQLKAAVNPSFEHIHKTTSLIKSLNQQENTYYREKLDSIEYYEPVIIPIYDSLNIEIIEYKTDENGNIIERTHQKSNEFNQEWEYTVKYVSSFNENDKLVEQIKYEHNGTEWQKSVVFEDVYDAFGNRIKYIENIFKSSADTIFLAERKEWVFDENNRILSATQYDLLNYGEEIVVNKYEYTYTENGDVNTLIKCYNWDTDLNTWKSQSKNEYTYDVKGNVLCELLSNWDINKNKWVISFKIEYEYLDDGSIIENIFNRNSQTDTLQLANQNHYKFEREYENDLLIEEIRTEFTGGRWVNKWKKEYKYDERGNRIFYAVYETPFSDAKWELIVKDERKYSEEGALLFYAYESYKIDSERNLKVGMSSYAGHYDQSGIIKSSVQYQWDDTSMDWLINKKNHRIDGENGKYESKTFLFIQNGTKTSFEKSNYTHIYEYDHAIGRYTAIKEGGYYEQHISYNEDLKVKEILKREVNVQDEKKAVVHYDELNRDTAWCHYRYDHNAGEWRYSWKQLFSYYNLADDNVKVTERWIDYSGNYGIDYYYSGEKLLATVFIGFSESNDSTSYIYNNKGQIIQKFRIGGEYSSKFDYTLLYDTLEITRFVKHRENITWELQGKDLFKIDTTINKTQVQLFPVTFGDDFNLFFDYGKVEHCRYFNYNEYEQSSGEINIYHYSPASTLSGDAVINGYVYEAPGIEKSVSITQETGDPVSGVKVSLLALDDDFQIATDTTNANGFYEFKGVPKGNFYLKIEHEDYNQTSTYEIEVTSDVTVIENKNFKLENNSIVTGLDELKSEIRIYPNPASDYITVQSPSVINSLKIIDASGAVKFIDDNLNQKLLAIPVSAYAPGVYFFRITTSDKNYQKRFIVE